MTLQIVQLVATCSSGSRTYDAHVESTDHDGLPAIIYRVVPVGGDLANDFFEARFVEVERGTWQLDVIEAHLLSLKGRGIGPAILLDMKRRTNAEVRSSSNLPGASGPQTQQRTNSATQMWERMQSRGYARYKPREDRYYVL